MRNGKEYAPPPMGRKEKIQIALILPLMATILYAASHFAEPSHESPKPPPPQPSGEPSGVVIPQGSILKIQK